MRRKNMNHTPPFRKTGQAEVVGLMIIVVIITIAMLFYLSYVTLQSDENVATNIRKEFIDNELSASFVQSLIRTSVIECDNIPLDVIIKDCGLAEGLIDCGSISSCEAVRFTIDTILVQTLDKWDKSYSLQVKFGETSDVDDFVNSTYGCAEGVEGRRAPGVQPIPYYPEPGTAFLELAVCKR